MHSPIRWIGGKGKMVSKVLPFFPAHETYVEAFGGGASLLLAKKASKVEVYNDANTALVQLFRDLKERGSSLYTEVALTPFSRREQAHTRVRLDRSGADVMVAYRQSFGGKISGYGIEKTSNGEMATTVANYLKAIERLPALSRRLAHVDIRQGDALDVIAEFDGPDTLHYLDPPYVPDSWTNEDVYAGHLMPVEAHEALVDRLLAVKGMVVLSGYPNDVYAPLRAAGWREYHFEVSCSVAARTDSHGLKGAGAVSAKQARTECLWANPAAEDRR